MKPLLVIGLDGASFDFIRPMVLAGRLPAFKRLMDSGVHGELESTVPPVTIPAWPAMFTGKGPGKIGAFDFRRMDPDYAMKTHNLSTMECRYVWEYLNDAGLKAAALNVPGTWPIRKVDGYLVSGMLAPPGRDFAYPPELQERIEKELPGYDTVLMSGGGKIDSSYKTFDHRLRMLRWFLPKLGSELDAIVMVFRVPDVLSHAMEAGRKEMEECYSRIDSELDSILSGMDCNTIIVSDHGYMFSGGPMFFLNTWLHKKGFLSFAGSGPQSSGAKLAVRRALMGRRRGRMAKAVLRKMGRQPPSFTSAFSTEGLDMHRTMAFSYNTTTSQYAGIWINLADRYDKGSVSENVFPDLKAEIMGMLMAEDIVDNVWDADDLYGSSGGALPDIVVRGKGLVSTGFSGSLTSQYKGCHAPKGIFIAHGPDIDRGRQLHDSHITDVAPTMLHAFGLPVPSDMDGKVLDIFSPGSAQARSKPRSSAPSSSKDSIIDEKDNEKIVSRLRDLGYA